MLEELHLQTPVMDRQIENKMFPSEGGEDIIIIE